MFNKKYSKFILILGILLVVTTLTPIFSYPILKLYPKQEFQPLLRGIKTYPHRLFSFEFIIDPGTVKKNKSQYEKLINYFITALTVPGEDIWVNLSPYEKNKIIVEALSKTKMGTELLNQDYLLKKLTSSIIHPHHTIGKKFWNAIYKKADFYFGNRKIPLLTFQKIWVEPDKIVIYINQNTAFIGKYHLKAFLENDSLAFKKSPPKKFSNLYQHKNFTAFQKDYIALFKQIILPAIEEKINNNESFTPLRQITLATILAAWYKENSSNSFLTNNYINKNKSSEREVEMGKNKKNIKIIYQRYITLLEKSKNNFLKIGFKTADKKTIFYNYISGGYQFNSLHLWRHFVPSKLLERICNKSSQAPPIIVETSLYPLWGDGSYENSLSLRLVSKDIYKILKEVIGEAEKQYSSHVIIKVKHSSFTRNTLIPGGDLDGFIFYSDLNGHPLKKLKENLKVKLYSIGINDDEVKWLPLNQVNENQTLNPEQPHVLFYETGQGFKIPLEFNNSGILNIHWQSMTKSLARIKLLRLFGYITHQQLITSVLAKDEKHEKYLQEMTTFSSDVEKNKIKLSSQEKELIGNLNCYFAIGHPLNNENLIFDIKAYPHYHHLLNRLYQLGLIFPSIDGNGIYLVWHMAYPSFGLTPKTIPLNACWQPETTINTFNQWNGFLNSNDLFHTKNIDSPRECVKLIGTTSSVKTWFAYCKLKELIKTGDKNVIKEIIDILLEVIGIEENDNLFTNQKDIQRTMILRAFSETDSISLDKEIIIGLLEKLIRSDLLENEGYGFSLKYCLDCIDKHFNPKDHHLLCLNLLLKLYPLSEANSPFTKADAWKTINLLQKKITQMSQQEIQEFISLFQYIPGEYQYLWRFQELRNPQNQSFNSLPFDSFLSKYRKKRYNNSQEIEKLEESLEIMGTLPIKQNQKLNKLLASRKELTESYENTIQDKIKREEVIRILQFNQLMDISKDRLSLMINYFKDLTNQNKPKVITLQETTLNPAKQINSAKEMAQALGYRLYHVPYRNHKSFLEGLAILFDPSLVVIKTFKKIIKIIENNEEKDTRLLIGLHLLSKKTKQQYCIFTTHLSGHPDCDGWRKQELEEIKEYINMETNKNIPVFLTGDFNYRDQEEGKNAQIILTDYTDSYQSLYPKCQGYTYSRRNPLVEFSSKRLDIVYSQKRNGEILDSRIVLNNTPRFCSDHFALITDIYTSKRFNSITFPKIPIIDIWKNYLDIKKVGGISLRYQTSQTKREKPDTIKTKIPLKGLKIKIEKIRKF